jgi:hypothetical protein
MTGFCEEAASVRTTKRNVHRDFFNNCFINILLLPYVLP